jgi:hypothetical protein
MNNIINFDNSRKLQNCTNLCYNNTILHFLYSLKDFRNYIFQIDKLKNTQIGQNVILTPFEKSTIDRDLDVILLNFKILFFMMNNNLTRNTYKNYIHNNKELICTRTNIFFKDIYEPIVIKSLNIYSINNRVVDSAPLHFNNAEYGRLDKFIKFNLNTLSTISDKLFVHEIENLYNVDNLENNIRKYIFPTNSLLNPSIRSPNKYIIVEPIQIIEQEPIIPRIRVRFDSGICNYILIGIFSGYKEGTFNYPTGHYWFDLVNTLDISNPENTTFDRVDDLCPFIKNTRRSRPGYSHHLGDARNIHGDGIYYSLYIIDESMHPRGDYFYNILHSHDNEFTISNQIKELTKYSNNLSTLPKNNINETSHEILLNIIKRKL